MSKVNLRFRGSGRLTKTQLAAIWAKRIRQDRSADLEKIREGLVIRADDAAMIRSARRRRFAPIQDFYPKLRDLETRGLLDEKYMQGAGPGQFDREMRQRLAAKLRMLRRDTGVSLKPFQDLKYKKEDLIDKITQTPDRRSQKLLLEKYYEADDPAIRTDWIKKQGALKARKFRNRVKNAVASGKSPFPERYDTEYLAGRFRGKYPDWRRYDPVLGTKWNLGQSKTLGETQSNMMSEFRRRFGEVFKADQVAGVKLKRRPSNIVSIENAKKRKRK